MERMKKEMPDLQKVKLIIFDFDGTLADTKEIYKKQIFSELKEHCYRIDANKFNKNFGIRLDRMLKKLNVRKHRKTITEHVNNYVIKNVKRIKPCPGISIVNKLKNRGFKTALISNSVTRFIKTCAKHLKIAQNFDFILGGDKFISKVQAFKMLFGKLKISPQEAVYVADRAGDILVARHAHCIMISISNKYSWSSRKAIIESEPNFIIKNLKDLKSLL